MSINKTYRFNRSELGSS